MKKPVIAPPVTMVYVDLAPDEIATRKQTIVDLTLSRDDLLEGAKTAVVRAREQAREARVKSKAMDAVIATLCREVRSRQAPKPAQTELPLAAVPASVTSTVAAPAVTTPALPADVMGRSASIEAGVEACVSGFRRARDPGELHEASVAADAFVLAWHPSVAQCQRLDTANTVARARLTADDKAPSVKAAVPQPKRDRSDAECDVLLFALRPNRPVLAACEHVMLIRVTGGAWELAGESMGSAQDADRLMMGVVLRLHASGGTLRRYATGDLVEEREIERHDFTRDTAPTLATEGSSPLVASTDAPRVTRRVARGPNKPKPVALVPTVEGS